MQFGYLEKMAKVFANNGDPDQVPYFAASDLDLHCLPSHSFGVFRLKWVKNLAPGYTFYQPGAVDVCQKIP